MHEFVQCVCFLKELVIGFKGNCARHAYKQKRGSKNLVFESQHFRLGVRPLVSAKTELSENA